MGRALAALGAVAVFAAGIGIGTQLGRGATTPAPGSPGSPVGRGDGPVAVFGDGDLQLVGALTSFDACDDLLDHLKRHALEQVGPWGLGGGGWGRPMPGIAFRALGGADGAAMAMEDSGAGGANFAAPTAGTTPEGVSGTNVQEDGVDEPDVVKTDGSTVYLVSGSSLRILDVRGDDPVELSTLSLGNAWGAQLLLDGDRLLVTTPGGAFIPFAREVAGRSASSSWDPWGGGYGTTLTSIDVSNPRAPVVTERLILDGATLSARMVDGVARVAIRTEAGINLPWVYPDTSSLRGERQAQQANEQLIRSSTVEDWLPYYVHETADGASDEGVLLDCGRVARPLEFSGLGTLTILTIDVGAGALRPGSGAVGVLAGGNTVYASKDRMYLATTTWQGQNDGRTSATVGDDVVTEIHAFDITDPRSTGYLASGEVPGVLLSQWSLSEHDGVLRVASTKGNTWWWGGPGEESSSLVTTLAVEPGTLRQLGQVGELGPTERIYAVRFMGEVGYVVTFRETDPLYVLDLSNPASPRVTGELKIPGYSAYLHPVGDGLLIGVGQDATDEGMRLGTQVSLFDVRDPADPRRIDQLTIKDSESPVEHDHRAFLHWPATGLNVIPVNRWWSERPPAGAPNGALALRVVDGRLRGIGGRDPGEIALTHAESSPASTNDRERMAIWDKSWNAAITRSLVTGDRLLTFSEDGVAVHDLATLQTRGRLTYRGR